MFGDVNIVIIFELSNPFSLFYYIIGTLAKLKIHYFIVGIGYLVIDRIGVPVSMRIPATALFVFAVSWAVVSLLYKACPKVAKWVMG